MKEVDLKKMNAEKRKIVLPLEEKSQLSTSQLRALKEELPPKTKTRMLCKNCMEIYQIKSKELLVLISCLEGRKEEDLGWGDGYIESPSCRICHKKDPSLIEGPFFFKKIPN